MPMASLKDFNMTEHEVDQLRGMPHLVFGKKLVYCLMIGEHEVDQLEGIPHLLSSKKLVYCLTI